MFLWLDPIRLTQHGHPHPALGRRRSRGSGPVPLIEALHQQRFFFIRLNFSERTVKSPSYPPKAEPRAMPHLPSTKKRTESAHARPTSLQHPPRKSGGAGAVMSSGLRPTERVARSANAPDMATHEGDEINVKCRWKVRLLWKKKLENCSQLEMMVEEAPFPPTNNKEQQQERKKAQRNVNVKIWILPFTIEFSLYVLQNEQKMSTNSHV